MLERRHRLVYYLNFCQTKHYICYESIKTKMYIILFSAKEEALKKEKTSGKRNQVTPEKNDEPETLNWLDKVFTCILPFSLNRILFSKWILPLIRF